MVVGFKVVEAQTREIGDEGRSGWPRRRVRRAAAPDVIESLGLAERAGSYKPAKRRFANRSISSGAWERGRAEGRRVTPGRALP